ncbi:DUF411 domain-containing protein [Allosphingosinicella vermicomposti]|uniref:DUF411 domain-containing protein n=1 Tax=Allosphingosinicella vermicomposti TaxID=614671 RepID=UPI000D1113E6|nr:DUF411 domain-containing protein [Allosphingosinicella vermicomposti]
MKVPKLSFVALPLALLACTQAAAATVEVIKSPYCGCCTEWVKHLQEHGFQVKVIETENVDAAAKALGIPDDLRSCHSAKVGSYAVEGHVPASDIQRMLKTKPKAIGIAVPGMPIGSPGMEQGNMRQPYKAILFAAQGSRKVFAQH